jgi:radical SAM/Cys-rich protein
MRDTLPLLEVSDFPALQRSSLTTLQVNLGYLCNLSCVHCHVNAGPTRKELMTAETVDLVLEVIAAHGIETLDLTGGAPEMNPEFRRLVSAASAMGVEVIDRCNLVILEEEGYDDLPQFLADHNVTVVASLPCYSELNVEKQRGKGVFARSIDGIRALNRVGYGEGGKHQLHLVYNPVGAHLPPPQQQLQADYKARLQQDFGVVFNELFTITNMPINRFGNVLLAKGEFDDYLQLLKDNFSEANLASVMCRSLISVDWQGNLFDCDFNQMLHVPTAQGARHLRELLQENSEGNAIAVADHCYACTAGQGSSCGGALD